MRPKKSDNAWSATVEWHYLPVVVLEQILSLLPLADRFNCSLVCRHWLNVFQSGAVWRRLVISDRSFTRRKYRSVLPGLLVHQGEELELNHWRFQVYLGRYGCHSHSITFQPITNFFNLYEFIRVVSLFLEFFDEYPLPVLDRFSFTFSCETRDRDGDRIVHGTGGQILAELLRLLGNLRQLRHLSVSNLLLDEQDATARPLLGALADNCRDTLRSLQLVNITRLPNDSVVKSVESLCHLTELTVSLQQLSDAGLLSISRHCQALQHLCLVEDFYTVYYYSRLPDGLMRPLAAETWRQVRAGLARLRVRLVYRAPRPHVETLQDSSAPVTAISYDNPWSLASTDSLCAIADRHAASLRSFGHEGLLRRYRSASFGSRADSSLVEFVRRCRQLRRVVVRERVSTATLIVLAHEGRATLEDLLVRRNAVILRCDWSRADVDSDELYGCLRSAAQSYERTEREISRILARPSWTMLSDHVFKRLHV